MVHGAMYDAVAAIDGELEPFATGVTAPPGASADAAVAQAARDVLVVRVPGQAATVQGAVRRVHGVDSGRACEGEGQGRGRRSRGRHARDEDRRRLRRQRAVRPDSAGPGRVRADRSDAASSTPSCRSCGRSRTTRRPTTGPGGPPRMTSRRYAMDLTEVQTHRPRHQRRPNAVPDRDRPLPHRADVLPVQPHAA